MGYETETSLQKRILYLLRSGTTTRAVQVLMKVAYGDNKLCTMARVRAISILLKVAGPEDILAVDPGAVYQDIRYARGVNVVGITCRC
jgi:hypothetical protein